MDYPAIEAACNAAAARPNISASYRAELTHIALDCRWAAEGCEASAQSVSEWLDAHDELEIALAAEGTSSWGMAA